MLDPKIAAAEFFFDQARRKLHLPTLII